MVAVSGKMLNCKPTKTYKQVTSKTEIIHSRTNQKKGNKIKCSMLLHHRIRPHTFRAKEPENEKKNNFEKVYEGNFF